MKGQHLVALDTLNGESLTPPYQSSEQLNTINFSVHRSIMGLRFPFYAHLTVLSSRELARAADVNSAD